MKRKKNTNSENWAGEHRSANFIWLLGFTGVLFLGINIWLNIGEEPVISKLISNKTIREFIEKFFTELSITAIIGSLAAIFLSFRDVRHNLAEAIGTLLSEGKAIDLLSPQTRDVLCKQIFYLRVTRSVSLINDQLFLHLNSLTENCLKVEHFYNYTVRQVFSPHRVEDLLFVEVTRSFSVEIAHLNKPVDFDFRLAHEIILMEGFSGLKESDFLGKFEATFGKYKFEQRGKEIINSMDGEVVGKVVKYEDNGTKILRLDFRPKISLDRDIEVLINYKVLALKKDNVTAVVARYPTRGFSASVDYDNQYEYDFRWFKGWLNCDTNDKIFPGPDIPPGRHENGIDVLSNSWILPGEGVMISWVPKPQANNLVAPDNKETVG